MMPCRGWSGVLDANAPLPARPGDGISFFCAAVNTVTILEFVGLLLQ
jgi:hypothetical protein